MLKSGKARVNYKVLEDPRMARQALQTLLKTREELDDLIDTLEMLSDARFRKNLERATKEIDEGKAVKMTVKELRKRLK